MGDIRLQQARYSGLMYLMLAITAPLGLIVVPLKLFIAGDIPATMSAILASETLFRSGIVSMFVGQIFFILLVMGLYKLLVEVHKPTAQLMVALVIASVPIAFLQGFVQAGTLLLLKNSAMITAFSQDQVYAMANYLLEVSKTAEYIVCIFWGLWLIPFGVLFWRSGFMPILLGGLLILGGISYVSNSMVFLINPAIHDEVSKFTSIPIALGEILTVLWLLIFGVKRSK